MRYLILFCAILAAAMPALAANKNKIAATIAAIDALTAYCLPAVRDRQDTASFAISKGLIALPPEQALKFSPEGGQVFAISESMGNAVLMAHQSYGHSCAIAVHEIVPEKFWDALDQKLAGFSLMREKRVEEDRLTKKEYRLETLGGPVILLVTGSDVPRPGGMQALLTLARTAK
jgi:hypothetical protein